MAKPESARLGIAESYRQLAAFQKSKVGVSLYSRWINRPLGRILAAAAAGCGLSPNQVSVISMVATLSGLVVMATASPTVWTGIATGLLLILGFALDSADGQLARLQQRSSRIGEWLDHLIDSGKMVCVHAAVLIAAYRFYDVPASWLLLPLAFQLAATLTFSGMVLVKFLAPAAGDRAVRAPSTVRAVGLLPADYGVLACCFLLSGIPMVFVPLYSVLAVLNVIVAVLLLAKWFGELK